MPALRSEADRSLFGDAFPPRLEFVVLFQVRRQFPKLMKSMVIPTGIEPVTYRLGICRSILLSYGTTRPDT